MNYFSEKLQSHFLKFSRQKAETDRIQNEILSVLNFQIHSPLTTVIEVVYFLLYTRVSSSLVSSVVLEKVCDECDLLCSLLWTATTVPRGTTMIEAALAVISSSLKTSVVSSFSPLVSSVISDLCEFCGQNFKDILKLSRRIFCEK